MFMFGLPTSINVLFSALLSLKSYQQNFFGGVRSGSIYIKAGVENRSGEPIIPGKP